MSIRAEPCATPIIKAEAINLGACRTRTSRPAVGMPLVGGAPLRPSGINAVAATDRASMMKKGRLPLRSRKSRDAEPAAVPPMKQAT